MRRFFFAFAASLALAACSGSTGSSVTSSSTLPDVDLTGRWTGSSTTSTGFTGTFVSDLVQQGAVLTGTVRSPDSCIGGGKVAGTVAGDRVDATVTAGDVRVTLVLTVSSEDQLDGTFELPASGACAGQSGSVSMSR